MSPPENNSNESTSSPPPALKVASGSVSDDGGVTLNLDAPRNNKVAVVTFPSEASLSSGTATTGISQRNTAFVSRHRHELNRIKTDATHSRSYPVPHYFGDDDDDDEEDEGNHRYDNAEVVYGGGDHNSGSDGDGSSGSGSAGSGGRRNNDNSSTAYNNSKKKKKQMSTCDKFKMSCNKQKNQIVSKYCSSNMTSHDWIAVFLPCWAWLRVYQWKSTITKDLLAGLTVGVMIVPQSMSYAKLAGLPVQYGLYSALAPVFAYSLFGSSRQLAIGPVALISLLLSTGLSSIMSSRGLTPSDPDYLTQYAVLAVQTSFLVGVVNIAMGLCKMGFVTIFLSHAVISGFTSGAAVIIGASQLKYILGYPIERSDRIQDILESLFANISQFNWKTFVMGSLSILLLVSLKNVGKKFPKFKWVRAIGPLAVTVIAIAMVAAINLDERGIPIVGSIPRGLPIFTGSWWTPIGDFGQLFVLVISIVIVGFMESIAIAKQLASKHKYEIDSSMELIGLGMANFVGGMFQSYPVTGSFSRSAVNNESGAQSGIAGAVTAVIVGFVLLFLTSVFELLPLNTLAAIVISGVLGLLDFEEAAKLWKVHTFDFCVWMIAFLGTMFLGVEIGLAIAVGVSLLIVIYEAAYPHTAVLGRLPGTSVYRNVKQYPQAELYDGIVIVRIDAPLFFANAQNVRDKIRKYRLAAEKRLAEDGRGELKYLIIELTPVSHLDTSALHILEDMLVNYSSRGQQLCFTNPSLLVMKRMVSSGFADRCGREHFFSCSHDAVNWCLDQMDLEAMSEHLSTRRIDDVEIDSLLNDHQGGAGSDTDDAESTEGKQRVEIVALPGSSHMD